MTPTIQGTITAKPRPGSRAVQAGAGQTRTEPDGTDRHEAERTGAGGGTGRDCTGRHGTGQSRAERSGAGQGSAGQGSAGQGRAGQGRAGQGRAGQGRGDQNRTLLIALPSLRRRRSSCHGSGLGISAHCSVVNGLWGAEAVITAVIDSQWLARLDCRCWAGSDASTGGGYGNRPQQLPQLASST
eukprot:gene24595-biopygen2926